MTKEKKKEEAANPITEDEAKDVVGGTTAGTWDPTHPRRQHRTPDLSGVRPHLGR